MFIHFLACTAPETLDPGDTARADTQRADDTGDPKDAEPWACEPLELPDAYRELSPGDDLQAAVDQATTGDVLLLTAGTYDVDGTLWIRTPGITLRGTSSDDVILDANRQGASVITVAASNVTVAHLTTKNAWYHGLHIRPESTPVDNPLIYDVHVWNPGEQAIKINQQDALYVDNGQIACSRMTLDDDGRPHIRNNCYTGGVDAHRTRGWVIRDNTIDGFWCETGLAEHGIHMWRQNADTLIQRNRVTNSARGIGLGLTATSDGNERTHDAAGCPEVDYIDDYRGTLVNNLVHVTDTRVPVDSGISIWNACDAVVQHNTVVLDVQPFSSIEWRFDGTTVVLKNNLVSHPVKDRGVTQVVEEGTLVDTTVTPSQDSPAVDAGVPTDVDHDLNGVSRDANPDIGALEWVME